MSEGRKRESARKIGEKDKYVNAFGAWGCREGRCFVTAHSGFILDGEGEVEQVISDSM